MFIRVWSAILLLFLFLLAACAKKEPAPVKEEAAPEAAKSAVTPGEMVLIPAGEFILGDNDKSSTAFPQQKINLPAFWIDKYETTGMEFLNFAVETGYAGQGAREGKDWRQFVTAEKAYDPVVYITWDDALTYCKSKGKRLPTEGEWEKAARGTDGRRYPWGNDWKSNLSNTYEAGLTKPASIGKFDGDVSVFGVHDMLGNVQEWTSSWYKPYKGNPKKDENFGERFRVVRGVSSRYYGERTHLWDRSAYLPGSLYDFGCRCAKDATPQEGGAGAETKN
jgi:formylglycine-generating enzyme required for sulfatase activity